MRLSWMLDSLHLDAADPTRTLRPRTPCWTPGDA